VKACDLGPEERDTLKLGKPATRLASGIRFFLQSRGPQSGI
jgi:hypothetical protein